jgi:hypothetical protein
MKSQIKSADHSGAMVALVIGPQELAIGTVGLRPLRIAGPQRNVARADLLAELHAFFAEHPADPARADPARADPADADADTDADEGTND